MSHHSVVMAVATYGSKSAAEQDFETVRGAIHRGPFVHVAATILEKGTDGLLSMDRDDRTATNAAWACALLGAALTVIATPVGMRFLASTVASRSTWIGVAALVAHFWQDIAKGELHEMSDLLEYGQAALVVVAVDGSREAVRTLMTNASATTIADSISADFETEFASAIDKAEPVEWERDDRRLPGSS